MLTDNIVSELNSLFSEGQFNLTFNITENSITSSEIGNVIKRVASTNGEDHGFNKVSIDCIDDDKRDRLSKINAIFLFFYGVYYKNSGITITITSNKINITSAVVTFSDLGIIMGDKNKGLKTGFFDPKNNNYQVKFFTELERYDHDNPDKDLKENLTVKAKSLINFVRKFDLKKNTGWLIINGKNSIDDFFKSIGNYNVCNGNQSLRVSSCEYSKNLINQLGRGELCFNDDAAGWISCKVTPGSDVMTTNPSEWDDKDLTDDVKCSLNVKNICKQGELCYMITSVQDKLSDDDCKIISSLTTDYLSKSSGLLSRDVSLSVAVGGALLLLIIVIIIIRKIYQGNKGNNYRYYGHK